MAEWMKEGGRVGEPEYARRYVDGNISGIFIVIGQANSLVGWLSFFNEGEKMYIL